MGSSSVLLFSTAIRRLEGKVSLITGGASGIGESTARLFAKHGAKVIIADIQDDFGHSVTKDINDSSSACASYVHCDVTKEEDVENAVNTAISKYGRLDIMFNNAGITGVNKTNILDLNKSEFDQVINVNLAGAFLGTKHASRVMIPACRGGSIITTASVSGCVAGLASHAYTASKHAVVGLTRSTAVELGGYGIRVNCVSPYVVATPLAKKFYELDDEGMSRFYSNANLKGATLEPQDVAEAALYLASDESKYMSGHNLVVDGGFTMKERRVAPKSEPRSAAPLDGPGAGAGTPVARTASPAVRVALGAGASAATPLTGITGVAPPTGTTSGPAAMTALRVAATKRRARTIFFISIVDE
ncbi:secoisolariciresinol dehydrogenase-like [Senna tora]|uniref:Secoisolariciresinol dehydrogenase-like n=1 Tax=Senna tora TaxID=362788 RepID=A0A834TMG4_9FABA|nr:secoisolariciresinol dehydrogenase-like [Senna tora]